MAMMDDDRDITRGPGPQRRDRPSPRQAPRVPLLRREDAGHRLQGPAGAQVLRHRARQDRPPPHQRELRPSSAEGPAGGSPCADHRSPPVHFAHALSPRRHSCPLIFKLSSSRTSTRSERAENGSAFAQASLATTCFHGSSPSPRRPRPSAASSTRRQSPSRAPRRPRRKHATSRRVSPPWPSPSPTRSARGRPPASDFVTVKDIEAALASRGFTVDRRKIHLAEPIKALGSYEVVVKLVSDVSATIKVEVVAK